MCPSGSEILETLNPNSPSLSLSLFLFSLWRLTPTTQERREKREEGGRKEMRPAQRVERRSDGSEHIAWLICGVGGDPLEALGSLARA
jgi:hypothetical protein